MKLLPLALLFVACAQPKPTVEFAPLEWVNPPSLQEQAKADSETLGLPSEEDPEKTNALQPKEFDPQALDKDAPSPYDGILIDEHTAGKQVLIKAERDRRRRELVIERDARNQERQICSMELNRLAEAARENEPTFWDEHKTEITFVAGVVIGAAAVVGSVYGLEQVK